MSRLVVAAALVCGLVSHPAYSQQASPAAPAVVPADVPPPPLSARSWVLLDFTSGAAIAQHQGDMRIHPASLTKIMASYVVFGKLKDEHLKLDDQVTISEKAWRTGGSRMFVEVNSRVSVEQLLKGVIIQSGNDASVALAEHVAGSEAGFAALMTAEARKLGLANSNFVNAPGLPDDDHYSSALDVALLSAAMIREFPDYYRWYSEADFTYNDITQQNRNILLGRDPSVDGIKTGHTESAGYCLAGSAVRDGVRLIAVVTGTDSPRRRAEEVQALLNYGFANYRTVELFTDFGGVASSPVFKGVGDSVTLGAPEPRFAVVPRGKAGSLTTDLRVQPHYIAPIGQGQTLGYASVSLDGKEVLMTPLVALHPVPEGGLMKRAIDSVKLWFE